MAISAGVGGGWSVRRGEDGARGATRGAVVWIEGCGDRIRSGGASWSMDPQRYEGARQISNQTFIMWPKPGGRSQVAAEALRLMVAGAWWRVGCWC